jgi:glycerophosphoryl diester phosphodiesterase
MKERTIMTAPTCPAGACAHRGDNHCAPENTLPAFELALAKGAHQIEFDVRTTADGQLVILHDETVDRTTNGSGAVGDLTFAQVRALDAGSWFGEQFAGVQIPTLAEVLSLMGGGEWVNCQLYLTAEHVPAVVSEIKNQNLLEQCFLACFLPELEAARAVEPNILVCSLEGQRGPDSDYPQRTVELGAQFIQLWGWADCMPETVVWLQERGVRVNYFGTEEAPMMRQLIEAGIDFVLTDHLDLMLEVLGEYGVAGLRR